MIPASFELPNLMVVAAVDQAGDPTNFTSGGRNVVVYANGFEVDSYVPGGERMAFSGTSMASPNVVNLAAKLFALDPELTPVEVKELIINGATPRGGEEDMLLIHPRRSADLLHQL
jgi:subtilisin family serine protease